LLVGCSGKSSPVIGAEDGTVYAFGPRKKPLTNIGTNSGSPAYRYRKKELP
jgi:hypothetical protein